MARTGAMALAGFAAALVAIASLSWPGGVRGAEDKAETKTDLTLPFSLQDSRQAKDQLEQKKDQAEPQQHQKDQPSTQQQPETPLPTAQSPLAQALSSGGGLGASTSSGATSNVTPPSVPTGSDAAAVLANSSAATGVDVQRRSPISYDPRIRGYHVGEVVTIADGAFWTPARIDLDTALGKINSDNIANIEVVKGPYSVTYGAGFALLNIETLHTPRTTDDCFEAHGSTSALFRSNGDGF